MPKKKNGSESQDEDRSPEYDAFEKLVKKVVRTPKSEIDNQPEPEEEESS